MRRVRWSGRSALSGAFVPIAALSLVSAPGCGGTPSSGQVEVDPKQQRQLQKLVTEDYGKMYKERYSSGRSYLPKTKAK